MKHTSRTASHVIALHATILRNYGGQTSPFNAQYLRARCTPIWLRGAEKSVRLTGKTWMLERCPQSAACGAILRCYFCPLAGGGSVMRSLAGGIS